MSHSRSANIIVAALLLLTLICAQWTGLQHRVAHSGSTAAGVQEISSGAEDEAPDQLAHSCLLLDAATLGVTLHTAFFIPVCLRNATIAISPSLASSWHELFVSHFSPRAPPVA